ncbi:primosomal protein N' [Patescibacteria group bacterium]|nr:primosomal protein N' [Patescibacteria group bacterium]
MDKKIFYYSIAPLTKIPLNRGSFFTYSATEKLAPGELVVIQLGKRKTYGIVYQTMDKGFGNRTKAISNRVFEQPVLSQDQIKTAEFISDYYLSPFGLTLKLMIPKILKHQRQINESRQTISQDKKPQLTKDQQLSVSTFRKAVEKNPATQFFLLGPTASGKTEVYMRIIDDALKQNKQALLLVPEISLVPQNIERFSKRFFEKKLAVLHSRQSNSEKFHHWQRIKNGQARIVIGPRSSIFAPFKELGLIIIDEAHDQSLKQFDQAPRYDSLIVAEFMSKKMKFPLLLGSATPSIEDYYQVKKKHFQLLELKSRIHQDKMPEIEIIDMKEEFKKKNFSVFSERLQEELAKTLSAKKQALLFINRRGTATFITCRDCGFVSNCPDCTVPLTYHLYSGSKYLTCHHCGQQFGAPKICPECKSKAIKYFGSGTEKVELELQKLFPQARFARMDKDTTTKKDSHDKFYQALKNHKIDVLIGTQMITKGWDLPKVDLVGIVSADVGLNLPDFRASERTFQLLTQVSGRTGRKDNRGKAILQTYYAENSIMKSVQHHNFLEYYQNEIKERKELDYPPFSKIIKLVIQDKNEAKASKEATKTSDLLSKKIKEFGFDLLGPAPAFIPKTHGSYKYQIILKFVKNEGPIKAFLKEKLQPDWKIDIDPVSLL